MIGKGEKIKNKILSLYITNVKVLFCPVITDIQNSTALFQGSHASPACPSDEGTVKMKMKIKMITKHW
jgi:hypothetical protein